MKSNILFINDCELSPTFGGIENITCALGNFLISEGYNVYSAYDHTIGEKYDKVHFMDHIYLNGKNDTSHLRDFIINHNIRVLILQSKFDIVNQISEIIKSNNIDVKVIFVHHMSPKSDYYIYKFKPYISTLFRNEDNIIKNLIRLLLLPIKFYKAKRDTVIKYKDVFKISDKIVLLDDGYIIDWMQIVQTKDRTKFSVIPNPTTYDVFFNINEYKLRKTKTVLTVARLCESQKKISKALKIWKIVSSKFLDWKFIIIGEGPDSEYYKKLVRELNIPRVYFEGMQNPLPYYSIASLYLMTSDHEAWSLTLMEAQQMGCVPVAFDTYRALRTVVNDNESAFVIDKNDMSSFSEKMSLLMSNQDLRKKMAENAIEHSKNFSKQKIFQKWTHLLNNL